MSIMNIHLCTAIIVMYIVLLKYLNIISRKWLNFIIINKWCTRGKYISNSVIWRIKTITVRLMYTCTCLSMGYDLSIRSYLCSIIMPFPSLTALICARNDNYFYYSQIRLLYQNTFPFRTGNHESESHPVDMIIYI